MGTNVQVPDRALYCYQQDILTAPGYSTPIALCECSVGVAVGGDGTSISATVERSVNYNPQTQLGDWAKAAATPITGNPATGIDTGLYTEPARAWWRVNLASLVGTNAKTSISGKPG